MQLTSKQWISLLVSLFIQKRDNVAIAVPEGTEAPSESFETQYHNAIQRLIAGCLLLAKNRLGVPEDFNAYHMLSINSRALGAFREAAVKWNAIVHGVRIQLIGEDLAPLCRAALLHSLVYDLQCYMDDGQISDSNAKAAARFYRELAELLNWTDHPDVGLKLDMIEVQAGRRAIEQQQKLALADLPEIEGYIRSVAEFDVMNRKLANGHKLHPKQLVKVDALRKWITVNRQDILAKIDRLPIEVHQRLLDQVTALLADIAKPAEELKAERAAAPRAAQPARKKHRRKKRVAKTPVVTERVLLGIQLETPEPATAVTLAAENTAEQVAA